MEKIIAYNLEDNFIEKLSEFICANFLKDGADLSSVACVFGGRRPALFLRRKLAKTINSGYIPPSVFTIDDFVDYLIPGGKYLKPLGQLDSSYIIYKLVLNHIPELTENRNNFGDFMSWAQEISSFIEQLDIEDISCDSLFDIQKSAEIGYEIPASINKILKCIGALRKDYHDYLIGKNIRSKGMRYLDASRLVSKASLDEYKVIIFCNFFYLYSTEQKIIKNIIDRGKGICIFQGSGDEWPVLEENFRNFSKPVSPSRIDNKPLDFSLYQGFDTHSQVCMVREIIKKIKNKDDTVIVVPDSKALVPLLAEISSIVDEFNVSMGYPLNKSPLYELFELIFKCQESRHDETYYANAYINLIKHPLIKNLLICETSSVTRVMMHTIEELLQGMQESSIGGSLFFKLEEIEKDPDVFSITKQTLANMDIAISHKQCEAVITEIHNSLFRAFEGVRDFSGFACTLQKLIDILLDKSRLLNFSFNLKALENIIMIKEDFQSVFFCKEPMAEDQLWEIFRQKLSSCRMSFTGSPLKKMQVLGLMETRSLTFENVIVLNVNESAIPKIKMYEPLIPREVMVRLGLNRLEKEEQIQRYQFMRLIRSAKNVHIIYEENYNKEKSRFIEELIWQKQRASGKIEPLSIPKVSFSINVSLPDAVIKKTPSMVNSLKSQTYSASRINTYLSCPLEFYYRYILGLKEKEELLGDLHSRHIGTFLHQLLEIAFSGFIGKKPKMDERFRKYFFKLMDEEFDRKLTRRMKSDSFLLKKIIKRRLDKFIDCEAERDVMRIICLEKKYFSTLTLEGSPIKFQYTVDRIDELKGNRIVVIDYKTGGADISPKKYSSLNNMQMERESIRENIKSFQLPLYYYFVSEQFPEKDVNAEIFNIRTLKRKAFIYEEDLGHKDEILRICLGALGKIIEEIFDIGVPFVPNKEEFRCRNCSFNDLCK
ncbi:MAG: PD-(D/E)XK nuclease family protein [Candidatus Omnitrophota bacterium]